MINRQKTPTNKIININSPNKSNSKNIRLEARMPHNFDNDEFELNNPSS